MKVNELWEVAKESFNEFIANATNDYEGYDYVGIRFEDKERKLNEICECSKHNTDREDERDFPEFDTEEYEEMEELDGTSSYDLSNKSNYEYMDFEADKDVTDEYLCDHCYIIAGNEVQYDEDGTFDEGEIVIENATVVKILY